MKKIRFGDILILILILSGSIFALTRTTNTNSGKVIVKADDKEYQYSLASDGIYSVPGLLGDTVFEIKDSKVHILSSPCPNKTCVQMGWADLLICLPNQVYISVEANSDEEGDFDAISK